MIKEGVFPVFYKKLNPAQKQAVDALDGPVMVIAGPGTGKTQILTLRIANILKKTDTAPESILALTFTESGVVAMRNRLGEIIGPAAWRVGMYTFHGFANTIIRKHPDAFPRIIGSESLTEPERIEILSHLLETLPVQHLRPFNAPLFYLRDVGRSISDLKRENVHPDDLKLLCSEEEKVFEEIPDLYHAKGVHVGKMKGKYESRKKKLEKNRDLLLLYAEYEKQLTKRKKYDFEDMVLEVVRGLRESDMLLREVAEEYHYILADEHQDANAAQNALLELLSSLDDQPNLFIVGDEKQAIFRFQGASLDNFLYFKKKFPKALIVPLTDNYRSGQPILDAAQSLIEKAPGDETLRIPLQAARETSKTRILLAAFSSKEYERAYIAKTIRERVEHGVQPEDIAVLFRTNQEGVFLRQALEKEGVRAVLDSDRNALHEVHVRALMTLLRVIARIGDDTLLPEVLHIGVLGIQPLDVYRFLAFGARERIPLYTLLKSADLLRRAGVEDGKKFLTLYAKLEAWHKAAQKENLALFAERVMRESDLLREATEGSGRDEALGALRAVFSGIQELLARNHAAKLPELIAWLDLFEEHRLPLRSDVPESSEAKVRLMTAHRAKGLEFEEVFVMGVEDGMWGNRREREYFYLPRVLGGAHDLDDERRLFYVALTRAKSRAVVSWSLTNEGGKEISPSVFVQEIDSELTEKIDTSIFEAEFDPALLFREPQSLRPKKEEHEFIRSLFLAQGLAVTGLNNYLDCPWKYFYVNLLRVPKVQEKALLFGTAIHEALRYFFDAWRKGKDIGTKALIRRFVEEVERQPLTVTELADMKKRGEKALDGWHAQYKGTWPKEGVSEFGITVDFPLEKETITLRGKLDRIDFSGDRAVVVDYKTGKPKSRKEIEGETRSSDGSYKRQLVFYKLLLDRFDQGKYHMEEGVLDFVEPDQKGKYHQERFSIDREELKELEEEIRRVSGEILELAFWDTACDDKKCEYCALRANLDSSVKV